MTEILKIILIALAFFVAGYLIARHNIHKEKKEVAKEAVRDSRGVTRGNINEELAILLPDFPGKFSEARHVGKPIDFLVFKGMDKGDIKEIGFVEVKTGKSDLTANERRIRDIVLEAKEKGGRVKWDVYRPDEEMAKKLES